MNEENPKKLDNENLLSRTRVLVQDEKNYTLAVLHHLREIESRELYLPRGYPSLFAFCVEFLGYEEGQAYRRIAAMRLLKELPELEKKVEQGAVSLTTLGKVHSFLREERKLKGSESQFKTKAEKQELVERCAGKSKRETEQLLNSYFPGKVKPDSERPLSAEQVELRVTLDFQLVKKLHRLRSLWSHKVPNANYNELLNEMADQLLKKVDPEWIDKNNSQKGEPKIGHEKSGQGRVSGEANTRPPVSRFPAKVNSVSALQPRYISSVLRREVWRRDQGQCAYRDPVTGKRCASKYWVQIDHIRPVSRGGPSTAENLRLLCSSHNQWKGSRMDLG